MIPKLIHQSQISSLSEEARNREQKSYVNLKSLNPGWTHKFYDDSEVSAWLKKNEKPRVLKAYNFIDPRYGPARADLFRYCVLKKEGGVWLDSKSYAVKPFSELFPLDTSFALTYWNTNLEGLSVPPWEWILRTGRGEIANWFLAFEPDHPFLHDLVERVVDNIENYDPNAHRVGKESVIWTTGPGALSLLFLETKHKYSNYILSENQFDGNLRYSVYSKFNSHTKVKGHYSTLRSPLVAGRRLKDLNQDPSYLLKRGRFQ